MFGRLLDAESAKESEFDDLHPVAAAQLKFAAEEKLRLATWIAAIMLPKDVNDALHKLRSQRVEAFEEGSFVSYIDTKRTAANKTYELLLEAAKRDLKF